MTNQIELRPMPVGEKVQAKRERQKRIAAMPFCSMCQRHIGTGGGLNATCGACAKPRALTLCELKRFARLVRKHWAGTARELIASRLHGYRPTLGVKLPHFAVLNEWDAADIRAERQACAERAWLADLYDRVMQTLNHPARACRA